VRRRVSLLAAVVAILASAMTSGAEPLPPLAADLLDVEYVTGDNGLPGGHIAIEGDRLYLGSYGLGMRIYDIKDPSAPALIGQYMPGARFDAVPDAAVWEGRHIAVLNGTKRAERTDRAEFLDVTDAANPKLLWTFEGPDHGESHNGDIVDKRKLWLPSGAKGRGGLRIYDMRPLLLPEPKAPDEVFAGNPVTMWRASPYRRGRDVGPAFTHTHDITVYTDYPVLVPRREWIDLNRDGKPDPTFRGKDIALLAEGGDYLNDAGNTGSIFVIDITDPSRPVVMLRWIHETGVGHHPIRYNHEAQLLDGDKHVMLVTDEDMHSGCGVSGGITAVRLWANMTDAHELSEWKVPAGAAEGICSTHVFSSKGKTVYMGAYNAGLQVIDYSDPRAPKVIGSYVAEGATAWGAYEHKGYVFMGDMTRGLDVLRPIRRKK